MDGGLWTWVGSYVADLSSSSTVGMSGRSCGVAALESGTTDRETEKQRNRETEKQITST